MINNLHYYTLLEKPSSVLNENSWGTIAKCAKDGSYSSLWQPGDYKIDGQGNICYYMPYTYIREYYDPQDRYIGDIFPGNMFFVIIKRNVEIASVLKPSFEYSYDGTYSFSNINWENSNLYTILQTTENSLSNDLKNLLPTSQVLLETVSSNGYDLYNYSGKLVPRVIPSRVPLSTFRSIINQSSDLKSLFWNHYFIEPGYSTYWQLNTWSTSSANPTIEATYYGQYFYEDSGSTASSNYSPYSEVSFSNGSITQITNPSSWDYLMWFVL